MNLLNNFETPLRYRIHTGIEILCWDDPVDSGIRKKKTKEKKLGYGLQALRRCVPVLFSLPSHVVNSLDCILETNDLDRFRVFRVKVNTFGSPGSVQAERDEVH